MRIMYMRNLGCLFIFLIRAITISCGSREFGVGVGVVLDVDSLEEKLRLSVVTISCGSREFGVGVGAVLDVDSLEEKLRLSYLSMATHNDFYPSYQSNKTGVLLHVRNFTWLIISDASDATQIGAIESFSSRWIKFLQNNTNIKQAKYGISGFGANNTLWSRPMAEERLSIRQQQLSAIGHLSESFNSTILFAFVPFNGSYDDLVHEIISRLMWSFDEAVGYSAITESGFGFVSGRYQRRVDKWRFLKPLTPELWLTSIALFLLTGVAVHIASEDGRDVNRLEYFSMTIFDPRHAREIRDFDDEGGGGGGGDGGGYSNAAQDQLPEMGIGGGRHRWWKKAWYLLKPAQHSKLSTPSSKNK